jgi:hypothetical protein
MKFVGVSVIITTREDRESFQHSFQLQTLFLVIRVSSRKPVTPDNHLNSQFRQFCRHCLRSSRPSLIVTETQIWHTNCPGIFPAHPLQSAKHKSMKIPISYSILCFIVSIEYNHINLLFCKPQFSETQNTHCGYIKKTHTSRPVTLKFNSRITLVIKP